MFFTWPPKAVRGSCSILINQATARARCAHTVPVRGDVVTIKKSRFQAHLCRVQSFSDVEPALIDIKLPKKIAKATHNIYAFRVKNADAEVLEKCYDDGEAGASQRLLDLIRAHGCDDVLICVTRWYGGVQLGPQRFREITNVARALLRDEGMQENRR